MKIGGENRFRGIELRHWLKCADDLGLSREFVINELVSLAGRLLPALLEAQGDICTELAPVRGENPLNEEEKKAFKEISEQSLSTVKTILRWVTEPAESDGSDG
ncbi:hypothetical protein [Arcanobacterium ihumii]|uniref:hypothetical protein n=1 Tax=Arcanobacterium ihumii TaxID=2138162 RepID=UPI000F54843F|nr:hypothetical protein [Arcanobacterium ihumii]